jgi:multidrug efflux pump subunit AcrB
VVVVEAIFYRLQRGMDALQATVAALREVAAPVTTSVLTTIAAFLPLMLLPGILGKFMMVIPLVVTIALTISLIEAYWMLPAHIMAADVSFTKTSRIHRLRTRMLHRLRLSYSKLLIRVLRWPKTSLSAVLLMMIVAFGALAAGAIRFDFLPAIRCGCFMSMSKCRPVPRWKRPWSSCWCSKIKYAPIPATKKSAPSSAMPVRCLPRSRRFSAISTGRFWSASIR